MYRKKKRKIETIETVNEYYQIIEKARNPPFTIIKKSDYEVNDFEVLISKKVTTPKNIRIREAKKIWYFPNSHVDVFYDLDVNQLISK